MPFLDAKALEIDPEGMAFLRSILKPETAEVRPAPSLPVPGLPSSVTAAPEERAAPRGPDAPTAPDAREAAGSRVPSSLSPVSTLISKTRRSV